jgi:hypothetical protein
MLKQACNPFSDTGDRAALYALHAISMLIAEHPASMRGLYKYTAGPPTFVEGLTSRKAMERGILLEPPRQGI